MPERVVAFDTETRGLDWFNPDQRAFMASWADAEGEYTADLSDEAQVSQFVQALESADRLVCHNLSFDTHQVRATLGWDALTAGVPIEDTDLMSRVMFPEGQRKDRGGHGLKNLATMYLRADAQAAEAHMFELADTAKIKMKEVGGYYDLWRAYPEVMERYARDDARFTYDLYEKFAGEIEDPNARIYGLERSLAPVLIGAEALGVRLDQAPVKSLLRKYKAEQAKIHDYLSTELGDAALGGKGSEEALTEALLSIGIPLTEKTETGKLATNKFALQKFEDEYPQITALFDFRRVNKFLKTYIEPMVDRDIVHPSFRQIGAWTGRMSCVRPNMQNIPKHANDGAGVEVRKMFIPREGYCFVVIDYAQIEFKLLAYYLNDMALIESLEDPDYDPFAWVAAQVYGGEYSYYRKGAPGAEQRQTCKNVTYAIVYGAGAKRIGKMLECSEDEARSYISKIKSTLPNYYRLNGRIRKKVTAYGHVNTMWGRTQIVNKDKAYVGLDALIQGTAGDIFKQGCVNTAEAVKPYGAYPLLFNHDEIVVECPLENGEQVYELTSQALCEAAEFRPALTVEGGIVTTSYADA